MGLQFDRYRNTTGNWIDWLSFYWRVGVPQYAYDDFHMLKYGICRGVRVIPKPTRSRERLIEYVYKEMNSLVNEYGGRTVIVVLGDGATPVKVNEQLFPADALLVNAQDALLGRLEALTSERLLEGVWTLVGFSAGSCRWPSE